ncbi:unnamed protein product [Paramecium sonneborni]|uniref:Uncharacterized protein n=1 Tax=Paramecium sonneborni TaxID=65129 RepID=A0A8S1RSP5_9CILI|nr:unnamed protein product [Paramecium sonneborni]
MMLIHLTLMDQIYHQKQKQTEENYYFFIDRSDQMKGQRIQIAKQLLVVFLQILPEFFLELMEKNVQKTIILQSIIIKQSNLIIQLDLPERNISQIIQNQSLQLKK